jgi:AraC-like DNA-binding protein
MTVTAVAHKSGFASVQYFCRAFASARGLSPAAWQAVNIR